MEGAASPPAPPRRDAGRSPAVTPRPVLPARPGSVRATAALGGSPTSMMRPPSASLPRAGLAALVVLGHLAFLAPAKAQKEPAAEVNVGQFFTVTEPI